MDDVFLLLFLLSPLALVIGLVKPNIFTRLFKRELSRKNIALVFGGATLLFFILSGVTTDTTKQEQTAKVEGNTQGSETSSDNSQSDETLGLANELTLEPSPTQQPTTIPPSKQNLQIVKVTRVIDGDTLKIETGEAVRLIGIDSPEKVHPSKPIQCYAEEASEKAKELLEGKDVLLEKDISETDKYDRLLRYVWIDDLLVNDYLVREGFAQSSSYPPDIKYQDKFAESQRKAREEGKGLWGSVCDD